MDHESIEELLAGYVLRALSGADAHEADRLLSEHVPVCARCRDTLAGFQEVAGDLALQASAARPPDTLLPSLHRDLGPQARRRSPVFVVAAAASFVALVGMAGFAVTQGIRANNATRTNEIAARFADFMSQPDANLKPVGPMKEALRPGYQDFFLVGQDVPDPAPGDVYRIWLGSGSSYTFVRDFRPSNGIVLLELRFDPSRFDRIVITEEPAGSVPGQPHDTRWAAATSG